MSDNQELLKEFNKLNINIPDYVDIYELKEMACKYQNLLWKRNDDKDWSVHDEKEIIDEITVRYLRFSCFYGDMIHLLYGNMDKDEVNELIFNKVLNMISSRYPHLASECEKQVKEFEAVKLLVANASP